MASEHEESCDVDSQPDRPYHTSIRVHREGNSKHNLGKGKGNGNHMKLTKDKGEDPTSKGKPLQELSAPKLRESLQLRRFLQLPGKSEIV